MNIGCITCFIGCLVFLFFAFLFTILGEKGAMLISGFNSLSKVETELYDKARMSKDQRKSFFIWSLILGTGAILSYLISQYIAIVAFVVWLIVFFQDVHLDEEKAFGKYKKQ
ncbi:MAG: DUF3784 domain-containing protein [Erysipelotrichaceae bacterium]